MKGSLTFRLYFLLSLAVILVVIVGFMSVFSVDRQVKDGQRVEHTYEVIGQIRDGRYWLLQARGFRRAYAISGNEYYRSQYLKAKAQLIPTIRTLNQLLMDNPSQGKRMVHLEDSLQQLMAYWDFGGRVLPQMDSAALRAIVNEEEKRLSTTYGLFDEIKAEETRLLLIRKKGSDESVGESKLIIITGVGLLLIIVLVLINTVIAAFKSRYKAGLRLQSSVDELAKVNALTEERNWLLSGISHITSVLQDARTMQDLGQKMLTAIINYIHLPAGALYLFDDEQRKLRIIASYSLPKQRSQTLALGEGLVGSAAKQPDIVVTKDVPVSYWQIESSTGFGAAGEIVCVPLFFMDKLVGVLELCSFGAFSEQELQLLRNLRNNLVVAVNSKLATDSVTKLLSQVQFQKEFLEQQQNTLKRTNEELQQKTLTLQQSQDELRHQEDELRQINTALEERNEAVEIARQTLSQKAKELEAASQYKSEFLANMSHELRTPLNSVLVLARLLADNKQGNLEPRQKEYAEVIHKSGNDLLSLINDILDLSKIEAGRVDMHFESARIASVMANMCSLFEALAGEKQVQFQVNNQLHDEQLSFVTDQPRVEQVLKNLLSNAFKFTPKQGQVSLVARLANEEELQKTSLSTKNPLLAFSVQDSGIGIPKEKQQLIFEAFQQADGSTSRRYGGTGLGLSISRELVRMLGGEIQLNSEESKGSCFTLLLPLTNAVAGHISSGEKFNGKERAFWPAAEVARQAIIPDDSHDEDAGKPLALIVEDDALFARSLAEFARHRGYRAVVALQGDEGLWCIQQMQPQVILLDLHLPVIDGYEILAALKQDPRYSQIPVHVISGAEEVNPKIGGSFTYLKKPARKEDLERLFTPGPAHLPALKNLLVMSVQGAEPEALTTLGKHRGLQTTFARNVSIAGELAKDHHYDALVLDIGGDAGAGLALVQKLKENSATQALPVLVCYDPGLSDAALELLRQSSLMQLSGAQDQQQALLKNVEQFLAEVQPAMAPAATNTHELPTAQPAPKPEAEALAGLQHKHVLVVDDDMRNVFVLSTLLEEYGMQVSSAADGKEALEWLHTQKRLPEMVLMDVMMPEMDGYEATRHIRQDGRLQHLPVVALTAKAMTGDREKCLEAGANDYLTKPLDRDALLRILIHYLN